MGKRLLGIVASVSVVVAGLGVPASGAVSGGTVPDKGTGFYFNSGKHGPADKVLTFGDADDEVFMGDWNGDGIDTPMSRRYGNVYFVRESFESSDQYSFRFGSADDEVFVGDWDGDGKDSLAVRKGKTFYFYNDLGSSSYDRRTAYGKQTDGVVVGDWDGDGKDSFAVRRGHAYYVSNDNAPGGADYVAYFGKSTDAVVAGDWDGDGVDGLAARRGRTYYQRNDIRSSVTDHVFTYGKNSDAHFASDWDGNGTDTIGVRRDDTYGSRLSDAQLRDAIIETSYKHIGTPYGIGHGQLDCSLFVQRVYAEFGINLPRTTSQQRYAGRVVSEKDALPGDLVWWSGHVGIYLGDGQYIAARNYSTPLYVSQLWRSNPTYIRVIN